MSTDTLTILTTTLACTTNCRNNTQSCEKPENRGIIIIIITIIKQLVTQHMTVKNKLTNCSYLLSCYYVICCYYHFMIHRTQIPEEDLEQIIESIHLHFQQKTSSEDIVKSDVEQTSSANERLTPSAEGRISQSSTSVVIDDRKLKNLRKKLEQIEGLKERQKKGEKLEANQASFVEVK